uniref:hypothetical protein n=2 Tax=Accumulibacter sp. TaxID=2053492 RepID=UPI002CE60F3B
MPPDAIGQAAVVMAEVERLAALDPSADGSDIALLARNRATLELIRAWCENAGIACAVGEGEQNGGPSLHQVREGCHLADFLRGKANHLLRCGTLARLFAARHRAAIGDNWLRADDEERRLYYVAMRRERGRRWRSARPTATATLSR